jgi:hypothetical protein
MIAGQRSGSRVAAMLEARKEQVRHGDAIERIREAAVSSPGVSDASTRQAAYDDIELPPPMGPYLAKVREAAPAITDQDFDQLRAAGYSEDAILELTVAAAVGAAGRAYDAARGALRARD